ncbi:MAG TPA: nuclear transport factor 2 family protein [Actinomadura sp.]|jgi:hypothetical protein|nr:nuclear transport factor 2 family protein [Actinomadura sp.]
MINSVTVVERQIAAYNAHDLEGFAATYARHVEIDRRDGTSLRGRDEVRTAYAPQFAAGRCRAEILGRLVQGEWVVDHEIAHGLSDDPVRVLVAYRIRDRLIDKVRFLA